MTDTALEETPVETAAPAETPGSRPLRNPKEERYARLRSLLMPKGEAYRQAGFEAKDHHAATGNAARLERRERIAERISYLCRQDEEVLKAKRARLEEFLWLVHDTNYADIWETFDEEILDEDGNPVVLDDGAIKTRRCQRLKLMSDMPEDLQRAIESLKYTDSGRPQVAMYSKMQANAELRKLLGLGAVSREPGDGEFERLSDAELMAELRAQARELGVDVDLTYRFRP